jgi:diguanylate cyclase (GGDEF)-like protein/PAS domain S-box-containing protein
VERALEEARVRRERRRTATELEIARERLQEREAGLALAQDMARLAHVITGTAGSFKTWSDSLPRLIGIDSAAMPTSTREWFERVHPDERSYFRRNCIDAEKSGERRDITYRLRHESGTWIHVRQLIEPLSSQWGGDGERRWFNTLQDITQHKAAEDRIKRLNRVYAVLSSVNSLIVRASDRDELFREACRIAVEAGHLRMAWLGSYDEKAQSIVPVAKHGHEDGFLGLISLSLGDPVPEGRGLVRRAVRGKRPVVINDIESDDIFRLRDAALARGYRSAAVVPLAIAGEVIGVFGFFAEEPGFFDEEEMRLLNELAGDISFALDHLKKAETLDYLALYDGLTGLSNRTLFLERLTQYIHAASDGQGKVAVVVSDLERFRAVNDSFGRQTGDVLLTQFSDRLAGSVPDRQQVSRLGADHFAVALPWVKNGLDAARLLASLAKTCFSEPFMVGETELLISAKAGLALYPEDGTDAETLLRNAEAALKRCKQTGERFLFFEQKMTERVAANLSLENQLRRALDRDEFRLHYQPRVDVQSRRILGMEALLRWQSKDRLVPPFEFIPLLEETGLILEVGTWALQRAVLEHQNWLAAGILAPRVAVNVSAVQLRQRDFVARVRRAVEQGATPTGLDLEITESMVMHDIADNIDKLRAIRELGVDVAIDDFGTGYSSLAYLARLPVGSLKIDRSFINAMLKDENSMTLVATIISLAHALGLKVVAEGVETEEQASLLGHLRCDQMQGYLFSKPLPPEQLLSLLRNSAD